MKITIDLTPEMAEKLKERTDKAIREMKESGFDFRDWTPELEATTILRMALNKND